MRTTPVAGPPGPSPARRPDEGPPPGAEQSFLAHLDKTEARTARAEGPKSRTTPADDRPATPEPEGAAAIAAPAPDVQETATPVATPDVVTPVPGTTVPEPTPVPGPESAHTIAGGGPAGVGTAGTGTGAGGAPTPAGMHAGVTGADDLAVPTDVVETIPATAPAGPAVPVGEPADPAAVAGAPTEVAAPGPDATAVADPEAPVEEPAEPTTSAPAAGPARPGRDGTPAPGADAGTPQDGAPGRGRPEGESHAATPATPATPAVPGQAAATPATPATPAAPTTPALPTLPPALAEAWTNRGLAHTVERLADLAHVATARGVARARLQLHPQELGGIEVRLRQSAAGLVATITAARADGLEALQSTAADLRRSLEDRGVTIARLDIELAARGDGGRPWQRDGHPAASAPSSSRSREVRGIGDAAPTEDDVDPAPAPTSTPAGVLVDVHA